MPLFTRGAELARVDRLLTKYRSELQTARANGAYALIVEVMACIDDLLDARLILRGGR